MNQKVNSDQFYKKRNLFRNDSNGPIIFAKEIMNLNPEPQQEKALILFQKYGRVALKAGHGVGKTVFLTILLFHQLYCHTNSIIACTAPTKHQLSDVLWTEAARWMNKSPILNHLFTWTATKIMVKGFEKIWYAVAIPSSNCDSIAGLHDKNLLFLLDEAPGIKEAAFPVIEGALTEKTNKIAMIGNPRKITGYFHSVFQKPQGWGTETFSCLDSKLVDPNFSKRIADRFGIDSNIYKVRVLGEFPSSEADSIISLDAVRKAQERTKPLEFLDVVEGGCDVARFGDDKTIIYIRRGYEVIDHYEIASSDLTVVQGAVMRMIRKHAPSSFKIDETGMGGGVVDNVALSCSQQGIVCDVIGVANNQNAVNSREYENAGTEMYFNLRDALEIASIPSDEDLIGELSMRTFTLHRASGRLMIIDKETLRADAKRKGIQGFKSPDKADALALCFYQSNSITEDEVRLY